MSKYGLVRYTSQAYPEHKNYAQGASEFGLPSTNTELLPTWIRQLFPQLGNHMKTYVRNVNFFQYLLVIVTKIKGIRRNTNYSNTYHWKRKVLHIPWSSLFLIGTHEVDYEWLRFPNTLHFSDRGKDFVLHCFADGDFFRSERVNSPAASSINIFYGL